MKKHIVSFSGGKDSTAMLLLMIEKGIRIDRIIFVDTTKEFPQMYEHIDKVKKMCDIEIEKATFDFDYFLGRYIKTRGKNKGKIGYGFPDFRNRWCTRCKVQAFNKKMNSIKSDYIQFHGIAFDEKHRCKDNENIRYPLVEFEIEEKQALEYCYSKGLDWGGLYEKFDRVSCWCCPLSRIGELRVLYNDFPELWLKLIEMDKLSYREFRSDYTVDQLTQKFSKENKIVNLFNV